MLTSALEEGAICCVQTSTEPLKKLIVKLLRHTYAGKGLWVLKGIHARGNGRVGRRDRQDIEALLRLRGITHLDMGHAAGVTGKLAAVPSPDVDFHDNY